MTRLKAVIAGLVVLVPALVVFASAGVFAQDEPTVQTADDPELGTFLTDAEGMTLYLFTKDSPNESACYDQCAENWPPFTAEEPLVLPEGVSGELTTIERTDGTTQVAYNGIPLYYFIQDEQPGDTNGQGAGDVWFVVAPGMMAAEALASPVASPMASPMAGTPVEVTLSEFAVMASTTTFTVGETYTFTATNAGEFTHELVIEPLDAVDEPLEANGEEAEIEEIESGQSGTLTWTFTEPGQFQLACHLRQHYQNGMVLAIEVTE